MDVVSFLLGIAIGILLTWFYVQSRYEKGIQKDAWNDLQKKYIQLSSERQFAEEKNTQLQQEFALLKEETRQKENTLQRLHAQIASLTTQEKIRTQEIATLSEEIKTYKLEILKREQLVLELTSKLGSLRNQLSDYQLFKEQLRESQQKILQLSVALSEKEKEIEHLKEWYTQYQSEIGQMQQKLTQNFEHLSHQILSQHAETLSLQNKNVLTDTLSPLYERLKEFEKKVEETYDKESKQRFALEKEVKNLYELSQHISREAHELTLALKGQTKLQGDWGEVILERLLEQSGLQRNREYVVQKTQQDGEGNTYKPDVVIILPQERYIVIDAKVSLLAYQRYCAATDQREQEIQREALLKSVRKHVDDLASKNYHALYREKSLDFVLLFMPIEPAYLLAIQTDMQLWEEAYQKRVLLSSPSTLNAMLKVVASLWKQELQSKNALEIAKQAGELYDKVALLLEDLLKVGEKIKQAQTAYEDVLHRISAGKGSLLARVEKIRELGARNLKKLPDIFSAVETGVSKDEKYLASD